MCVELSVNLRPRAVPLRGTKNPPLDESLGACPDPPQTPPRRRQRKQPMSNATALRDRAAQCREIAKEYHPSVGRPLYEKALELDREAARIERAGVERRQGVFPR